MKTVRYCLSLLSLTPIFHSSTSFSVKPLQSCRYGTESSVSLCFNFLNQAPNCVLDGGEKITRRCLNESLNASLLSTCITLKASVNSFHLIHFIPKTVERYCECSTGTTAAKAGGDEHKRINTEWTGAVMKHRCVPLTIKDLKSHIQSQ